ncbi:protein-histidine pros-kinase [Neorhodopirellula lusitana]|uniref:histidine kinase n=1 Tax=Neorhodopirellula lusitana TaxID=445327 RepID=A0ABY1PUP9_9BACT|nr:PAS domain S-box protein [Neorhodopirellula lusitana]SMP46946.1 protein-histidine pros-kinase [Neorhodopirellula lusitana]
MDTHQLTWQAFASALSDSIFMIREDASIFYANDFACESLGCTFEEMITKRVPDISPTYKATSWASAWERFRDHGSIRFESRHLHRDGREFPVMVSTTYYEDVFDFPFIVAHVKDISEPLANRQRLQLAIQSAKVGFWDMKTDENHIYVSPELCNQLGLPHDAEWTLQTWMDLLHPDDRQKAIDHAQSFMDGNEENYINWFRLRHANGSYRWIESRGCYVRDEYGELVRFMGTHLDVTAQKAVENELRRNLKETEVVKKSLQRSNDDLEQFAYVASHDLRAPLRGLKHLNDWIREDVADASVELPESISEHLRKMEDQVRRMDSLLSGLLEYSRVGRRQHMQREVSLMDILDDAVKMAGVPKGFRVIYPDHSPTWTTVREILQRIFQNLVDNAVKHHDQETGTIEIACVENDDEFVFSVIDDGPGIESKFRSRIFEIFQTLRKSKDQGATSGLGLTIVNKLLSNVGGSIEVLDAKPRGAEFRFVWPKQLELSEPVNPDKLPTT